jgi:hypothetical protein
MMQSLLIGQWTPSDIRSSPVEKRVTLAVNPDGTFVQDKVHVQTGREFRLVGTWVPRGADQATFSSEGHGDAHAVVSAAGHLVIMRFGRNTPVEFQRLA